MNKRSLKDKISKINWPELVFTAEAGREWFEDITIVTLKSEYLERAYDKAWKQIDDIDSLDKQVKVIMNSGELSVKEFIQIGEDYSVKVCIDRDEITDEVVDEVLDILADIGIKPKSYHNFGVMKTFTTDEITPIMIDG
jgi:hypothetical protein